MGEQLKRYRVTYQGKDSRQHMTLLARSPQEARQLADAAQAQRHSRFPLTFARMEESLKGADLKRETERRKRDQARYDDDTLKIESVREVG